MGHGRKTSKRSPELGAGIGRVKGAKRLGTRIRNWVTVELSKTLLGEPERDTPEPEFSKAQKVRQGETQSTNEGEAEVVVRQPTERP